LLVVTTVSNEVKANFATELGADKAINYKQSNFVDAFNEWTDGTVVNLGFDTVGGKELSQTFEAVRCYGDILTLLQPGTDTN
jgi:NADPH2:quinone reductase